MCILRREGTIHLSYATRDPDAASVARRLRRALEGQGIPVRTSSHTDGFGAADLACLVLLLSPTWWIDDAVQDAGHSRNLVRERRAVSDPKSDFNLPLVPVLVQGDWDEVAPDELRLASFYDLRAYSLEEEFRELLRVLRVLYDEHREGPARERPISSRGNNEPPR